MDKTSAIERAQSLGINLNEDRNSMKDGSVFISHYGWLKSPEGAEDPYMDSLTRKKIGNHDNTLNENSVALSRDLSEGFKFDDPIFINGFFVGIYADTAPEPRTIDFYDPNMTMPKNWGGTLFDPKITNKKFS